MLLFTTAVFFLKTSAQEQGSNENSSSEKFIVGAKPLDRNIFYKRYNTVKVPDEYGNTIVSYFPGNAYIDYSVSTSGNVAFNGINSPYYHVANRQGLSSVSPNSGYLRGLVTKRMNSYKKFDYGAGIDLAGAFGFSSPFVIQQAYGELQFHCLDLMIGSKQYWGELKNPLLSSGGMVWSGNARPIPQVRLGIFNFTEFPWTKGWLQVRLDIAYGRFTDDKYLKNEFIKTPGWFRTTGVFYHHKNMFFRSKESKRFIVTLGVEVSSQFRGDKYEYQYNHQTQQMEWGYYSYVPNRAKDYWRVFLPGKGDEYTDIGDQANIYGNFFGAYHFVLEYKFKNRSRLKTYFEWFFDDMSGVYRENGFDGLWGIEYNFGKKGIVTDVVVEYLETINQSGPLHWIPDDCPHCQVRERPVGGADNYYNNYYYNAWAHWGMTAGTPLIVSPAYNRDGYLCITNNLVRALHIGVSGYFRPEWNYRLLTSYNRGWGTPLLPLPKAVYSTSVMVEVTYSPYRCWGWSFLASYAFDVGTLYGNNSGVSLRIRKSGTLFHWFDKL